MRMLSRVAERLYWMARYLERAEDVARLTQAYTHLIMDIPEGSEPGWEILVQILDATPVFGEHHRVYNLSLIHISEPTRPAPFSRMPSSA